jgi:hypothetical protein
MSCPSYAWCCNEPPHELLLLNRDCPACLPACLAWPLQTHTFVSTQHVEAGTASYMAPECFKGNQGLSEKVSNSALGF